MRKSYQKVLRDAFRDHLINTRDTLHLTQAQMAEMLCMDERSYISLEHGKSCCGALTLSMFLLFCCPDSAKFLEELRHAFSIASEKAA